MPTTKQVPIQFTKDQLTRLRSLSSESGRSIAALVRDAVDRMLAPSAGVPAEALWLILRDPAHWQTFKEIALQHEAANAPPPAPTTWRHRKSDDVPPRPARVVPPPPPEGPMPCPFTS